MLQVKIPASQRTGQYTALLIFNLNAHYTLSNLLTKVTSSEGGALTHPISSTSSRITRIIYTSRRQQKTHMQRVHGAAEQRAVVERALA